MRILVVEDQEKMANFLCEGFRREKYDVTWAESGEKALSVLSLEKFDLVVLDVMLPGVDGIQVASQIREKGFAGAIIMLTALGSTKDKITGLDSGADDYMVKPFQFEELLARARAMLRRKIGQQIETRMKFSDVELDLVKRVALRAGQTIELTKREFALLEFFMRNPNRTVSRSELGEKVWEVRFDPESNVIDVYVNHLRKKIDQGNLQKLIHTVVGTGYMMKEGGSSEILRPSH